MEVVIVYGNQRKGNTYHCVKIIREAMETQGEVNFTEIWLPEALPYFCVGCFNCFTKGENTCPHYDYVKLIVEKLLACDGIILASPVYGLNVTAAMKNLLDHLCYMWMVHRPNQLMFSKVGFLLSTTAGAGTGYTNKTMARTLDFMGIKKRFSYGVAVAASHWGEVEESKKVKIAKALNKKAIKFYQSLINRHQISYRWFTRILFLVMKGMIKGFEDGYYDKEYWKRQGWLEEKSPFKTQGEVQQYIAK